jgi:hypothetical protein
MGTVGKYERSKECGSCKRGQIRLCWAKTFSLHPVIVVSLLNHSRYLKWRVHLVQCRLTYWDIARETLNATPTTNPYKLIMKIWRVRYQTDRGMDESSRWHEVLKFRGVKSGRKSESIADDSNSLGQYSILKTSFMSIVLIPNVVGSGLVIKDWTLGRILSVEIQMKWNWSIEMDSYLRRQVW